ncbi:MAG: hypothetical protein MZW92_72850 [Comamonadaceae bacterium]|nr:hypothetical protein [Comamonadaceae bacterium]
MKGYEVYLDGVFLGKEGTGGDQLDGVFKFRVVGGQTHTVRIFDGMNDYEKPMYFERGRGESDQRAACVHGLCLGWIIPRSATHFVWMLTA